jgi:hypothetical protein
MYLLETDDFTIDYDEKYYNDLKSNLDESEKESFETFISSKSFSILSGKLHGAIINSRYVSDMTLDQILDSMKMNLISDPDDAESSKKIDIKDVISETVKNESAHIKWLVSNKDVVDKTYLDKLDDIIDRFVFRTFASEQIFTNADDSGWIELANDCDTKFVLHGIYGTVIDPKYCVVLRDKNQKVYLGVFDIVAPEYGKYIMSRCLVVQPILFVKLENV